MIRLLLKMFLAQKRVDDIVIADEGAHLWRNSLKSGPQFPEATALDSDERPTLSSFFDALETCPETTPSLFSASSVCACRRSVV